MVQLNRSNFIPLAHNAIYSGIASSSERFSVNYWDTEMFWGNMKLHLHISPFLDAKIVNVVGVTPRLDKESLISSGQNYVPRNNV